MGGQVSETETESKPRVIWICPWTLIHKPAMVPNLRKFSLQPSIMEKNLQQSSLSLSLFAKQSSLSNL
jgi:hypothetical protein